MYTYCPKCNTPCLIEENGWQAENGDVTCSQCNTTFNAIAEELEQTYSNPMNNQSLFTHEEADGPLISLRAEPRNPASAYQTDDNDDDYVNQFAGFEKKKAKGSALSGRTTSQRFWGAAVLVVIAVLFVQIIQFETDRLAQQPNLRPWLERICPLLNCNVPEFRDLTQLQVIERDLTPARGGIDGLEFRAVFANYADQAQPYPRLKLTLSQLNGEPLARRIFNPEEYLQTFTNGRKMSADEVIEIHLTIANPGKDVGGFTFELL